MAKPRVTEPIPFRDFFLCRPPSDAVIYRASPPLRELWRIPQANRLTELGKRLAEVDLDWPDPRITELLQEALALDREGRRSVAIRPNIAPAVAKIAAGTLSDGTEVAKAIAKTGGEITRDEARSARSALHMASRERFGQALEVARAYGEREWLDHLRTAIDRALPARLSGRHGDEPLMKSTWAAAKILRELGITDGLRASRSTAVYFEYAYPERLHSFRMQMGNYREFTSWISADGTTTYIDGQPRAGRNLSWPERCSLGEPGIFSAAEALATIRRLEADCERTEADFMPNPEAAPRRRIASFA